MTLKICNRRNQIAFVTFVTIVTCCTAELFTALSDMEDLVETEGVLINNLEAYVEAQEKKLSFLRR